MNFKPPKRFCLDFLKSNFSRRYPTSFEDKYVICSNLKNTSHFRNVYCTSHFINYSNDFHIGTIYTTNGKNKVICTHTLIKLWVLKLEFLSSTTSYIK